MAVSVTMNCSAAKPLIVSFLPVRFTSTFERRDDVVGLPGFGLGHLGLRVGYAPFATCSRSCAKVSSVYCFFGRVEVPEDFAVETRDLGRSPWLSTAGDGLEPSRVRGRFVGAASVSRDHDGAFGRAVAEAAEATRDRLLLHHHGGMRREQQRERCRDCEEETAGGGQSRSRANSGA